MTTRGRKPGRDQKAKAEAAPDDRPRTVTTLHLPVELLALLRDAANRRAVARMLAGVKGTRPNVSEIVVELLDRHRGEIERIAEGEE